MARNKVQFQKGLSEPEFECPVCGERQHSALACRVLFQCSACRAVQRCGGFVW